MMLTIWDKKTRKIIHQTQDENLSKNYALKAAQNPDLYGYLRDDNNGVFPPPGYKLDTSGELVSMTYMEKVSAKIAPAPTSKQKIVVGSDNVEILVSKTNEELLKDGIETLDTFKSARKSVLYQQVIELLNRSVTKNGYATSTSAQQIASTSLAMVNLPDNDAGKSLLKAQGLLYSLEKSKEIIEYCSSITASFRKACATVDTALNLAQIDAIVLDNFL